MIMLNKKYNNNHLRIVYCIATFFLALFYVISGGAAHSAPIGKNDLKPLLELEDSQRELLRKKSPAGLEKLAKRSSSLWVRAEAARRLADHYVISGMRDEFEAHSKYAGDCANALAALSRGDLIVARKLADAVLREKPNSRACSKAQQALTSSGVARDAQVWRSIRFLVDKRRSKQARGLLPLLKDSKVSVGKLNNAIQQATRRMGLKAEVLDRVQQELLAVSAVVSSHSKPLAAGTRWNEHAKHLDEDIRGEVWTKLGKWAMLDHHYSEAMSYFSLAPYQAHGEQELEWRVRAALRSSNWGDVAKTIDAMSDEQASLSAWRYWEAYAHSKLGRASQMRAVMRQIAKEYDDFYGLLAKAHAGLAHELAEKEPDLDLIDKLEKNADVRMAIALGVSGRTVSARKIWKFLRQELNNSELLAISIIASDNNWLLGAINAADTVPPDQSNHNLRFPIAYEGSVMKYSSSFGLNPALVYAIMRQESRFNPKAISSAGARGLMQVMPSTARVVARRNKYTRYNKSRLTLPDTNIIIATRYLSDLQKELDNDPIYISASYNAGENVVRKWRKAAGNIDKAIFIETIPYTETRIYVKSILANLQHYDQLINGGEIQIARLVDLKKI